MAWTIEASRAPKRELRKLNRATAKQIVDDLKQLVVATVADGCMTVTCTSQTSPTAAKQAFKQRVRHWARTLEVPVVWLAVRPMPNKWASCSSNGHLHFSVSLLSLDHSLWDYVIVHELLHLSVPNHGKLWKSLMRAYLGDWETAAERLQQLAGIPSEPAPPADLEKRMGSIRSQSTHSPPQE